MSTTPISPSQRPFFTRRSVLWFATACLVGNLVYQFGPTGTTGVSGVVNALAISVALVAGGVAWAGGITLAVRSGSVLWMIVSCLPPPFGAVCCALWAPDRPPTVGQNR